MLRKETGVRTSCQMSKHLSQNVVTTASQVQNIQGIYQESNMYIVAHHIFVARDEEIDRYALAKSQGTNNKKLDSLLLEITCNSVLEPSATPSRLLTISPFHANVFLILSAETFGTPV